MTVTRVELSVILPFSDDEDVVGTAVTRIADHLREYGLASFEIIAVDEDSGDNSHAVLALLRPNVPELRVVHAGVRGRGFDVGARRAQGRALWLVEPKAATRPLAPFGRAYRRVTRGDRDAMVVKHRFVLCHRTRTLPAIEGSRGVGAQYQRRLAKRAEQRGLAVETVVLGGTEAPGRGFAQGRLQRFFEALAPARARD